jgi:hypothetical protein
MNWTVKKNVMFCKSISKRRIIPLRHSSILRQIWFNFMAFGLVFIRRGFFFSVFTFFSSDLLLFDLGITDKTWIVEMRILCIKHFNVLVLHFNPLVEASAGEVLVPEGLYSPVAKYFGTCFKIRIWIELTKKVHFCKFISKRKIISLRHSPRRILAQFHGTLVFIRQLFQFSHFFFGFPTVSTCASLKRLE